MPNPHIRIIIGSLEVGGTELHLTQILPSLADKGWKFTILVLSNKLTLKDRLNHPNITIESISSTNMRFSIYGNLIKCFKVFLLIRKNFLKDPHSLTHFFLPEAYFVGMILAKFYRLTGPLVMSRRSLNSYQRRHKVLGYLEPFLHRSCDLILVNSQAIKNQLIFDEAVPESKISIIYNGVDEHRFLKDVNKTCVKEDLDIPLNSFIMVVTANLIHYKGHHDLLDALGSIKNQLGSNWFLIVVGHDRGQLNPLKSQATSLGIDQHIRWVLNSQEPLPYLSIADIGILPSHEEGFSNAILEMMASGLPVITTDVGGNPEAVIHNKTGLITPSKNPKALGTAILSFFRTPKKRHAFGKAGKMHFHKHFTLPHCVEQYAKAYRLLTLKKPL